MTLDNDTSQRIRSLLEPHGYKVFDDLPHRRSSWSWETPNREIRFSNHGLHQIEEAIVHFLNDKAQTGARIADMVSNGPGEVLDLFAATYRPGDDVDEWWADEWLNYYSLPDPRKQVTA